MRTVTKVINGHEYLFVNQWLNTRSGFAHKSTIIMNGHEVAEAKVNYYNRTWESYDYQTSMRRAVENFIKAELDSLIYHYKRESGKSRITAEKKRELSTSTPLMLDLNDLYSSL